MKDSQTGGKQRSNLSGTFVFVLMGVFALFCIVMAMFSAALFKNVYTQAQAETEKRILFNYAVNAVRAYDCADSVFIQEKGGVKALVLSDTQGENVYENSIYLYNGALRELYLERDSEFIPEYGEVIAPAEAFDARLENGLLTLYITAPGGEERALRVYLRAGGGGRKP